MMSIEQAAARDLEASRMSAAPDKKPEGAAPVVISEFGETLRHFPSDHHPPTDEMELSTCVGIHSCNCWVYRHNVSLTHFALRCRSCGWRVVLPQTVKTFGDLRIHFGALQVPPIPRPPRPPPPPTDDPPGPREARS